MEMQTCKNYAAMAACKNFEVGDVVRFRERVPAPDGHWMAGGFVTGEIYNKLVDRVDVKVGIDRYRVYATDLNRD